MSYLTDALPAALRTRLEAYCRITGDDAEAVAHDAVAAFLDEHEDDADAIAADPLLQAGDALSRAIAKAMSS